MSELGVERVLLHHIEGPRAGEVDTFCQPTLVIGRAPDCHLIFSSERGVSGHHAVIRQNDGMIELEDSRSTNGTFVNDVRIERCALKHLDTIRLGSIGPLLRIELPERNAADHEPLAPTPPPASRMPPLNRPLLDVTMDSKDLAASIKRARQATDESTLNQTPRAGTPAPVVPPPPAAPAASQRQGSHRSVLSGQADKTPDQAASKSSATTAFIVVGALLVLGGIAVFLLLR